MPEIAANAISSQIDTVLGIFRDYLEKENYRKTPEREAILKEIYSLNNHFDVETLYIHMINNNYRVSRATVYNTLDLLEKCELVTKHQFGGNQAKYEKSYGFRQHDHLICDDCGKVLEFCDPRMQEIQNTMGELLGFDVQRHSLLLRGKCRKLAESGACHEDADLAGPVVE